MVQFAGWQLPVQYPTGIIKEHLQTRQQASLFDVSHMGQLWLTGAQVTRRLEALSPSDLIGLAAGRQCYTLLLNDGGGIEDDCMVAHLGEAFWVVVNAARRENDLALLQRALGGELQFLSRGLLALQGPAAETVLARLHPPVAALKFMDVISADLEGAECWIARSGYTGEDGFEISCPPQRAEALAEALLAQPEVAPAGLGARDSLRLEAGLCLYGQDLTPEISPVEAGLGWTVAKDRRADGSRPGGFAGAERILAEMQQGTVRKRVGLAAAGRIPVRSGARLYADEACSEQVGEVSSGGFGASLGEPCAMGYVSTPLAKKGQRLYSQVRNKTIELAVAPLRRIKSR